MNACYLALEFTTIDYKMLYIFETKVFKNFSKTFQINLMKLFLSDNEKKANIPLIVL